MALTTLEKVKAYLEIAADDTGRDEVLTRLIDSAQIAIENHCRRKFEAADYEENFDGPARRIFPEQYPIISIKTLTCGYDNTEIENYKNRETFIDLIYVYNDINLSYRAGYEEIPGDLEQACIMLVDYYYKTDIANYSRVFADTGGLISRPVNMPGHVKVLLEAYRKVLA